MKTDFKTRNDLTLVLLPGSTVPNFDLFKLGQANGLFQKGALSVNVILTNLENKDHLFDLVQWFTEYAVLAGLPLRVTVPTRGAELERLVTEFNFTKSHADTAVCWNFIKTPNAKAHAKA